MVDESRFEEARKKIIGIDRQRLSIGTLSEKTVHAVVKNYYEPDENKQEIPIGNYIADIYRDGEIIEIQTRQFDRLREKLKAFLPLCPVTIVYPIPREKWLIWIDEETGELSKRRKSPLKGSAYTIFKELYKIKMFLGEENLRLRLLLLDMEEYRLLNGWSRDKKRGSERYDRIPLRIVEEIFLNCPEDYLQLIPSKLKEPFTVKDFAKEVHIPVRLAGNVINILYNIGLLERAGKQERAFLYTVKEMQ